MKIQVSKSTIKALDTHQSTILFPYNFETNDRITLVDPDGNERQTRFVAPHTYVKL